MNVIYDYNASCFVKHCRKTTPDIGARRVQPVQYLYTHLTCYREDSGPRHSEFGNRKKSSPGNNSQFFPVKSNTTIVISTLYYTHFSGFDSGHLTTKEDNSGRDVANWKLLSVSSAKINWTSEWDFSHFSTISSCDEKLILKKSHLIPNLQIHVWLPSVSISTRTTSPAVKHNSVNAKPRIPWIENAFETWYPTLRWK